MNTPAWAIINGEDSHGITWHVIEGGVDEGDILAQRMVLIAEDERTLGVFRALKRLGVTETRPALVPLTFSDKRFAPLSGTSAPGRAACNGTAFDEAILFTHRGLSGPAILQISSYWREGDEIVLDLDPAGTLFDTLRDQRQREGRRNLTTELARHLPARLVEHLAPELGLTGNLADQSDARLTEITGALRNWHLKPTGSEGYRTAEVTLGGVDTAGLSSKTMMSAHVPGLYIIGEAVDVTGWLGGYNFQWAWSSGWAAGQAIRTG